jgi:hypothetical protein
MHGCHLLPRCCAGNSHSIVWPQLRVLPCSRELQRQLARLKSQALLSRCLAASETALHAACVQHHHSVHGLGADSEGDRQVSEHVVASALSTAAASIASLPLHLCQTREDRGAGSTAEPPQLEPGCAWAERALLASVVAHSEHLTGTGCSWTVSLIKTGSRMGSMRDSTDQDDGGLCWNASLVLAEYIATTQRHLAGSTVRERAMHCEHS